MCDRTNASGLQNAMYGHGVKRIQELVYGALDIAIDCDEFSIYRVPRTSITQSFAAGSFGVSLDEFPALHASFDKRIGGVEKVFLETKFSVPPSAGALYLSRVADWGNEI
ncbi:hypothetical protein B0H10DRAFT_827831 [Mycena sp. CBHHK59/15]|nr:hypothetical protein B0H10DRAFT_827831 [Mycena sp. CBHHK59/15]